MVFLIGTATNGFFFQAVWLIIWKMLSIKVGYSWYPFPGIFLSLWLHISITRFILCMNCPICWINTLLFILHSFYFCNQVFYFMSIQFIVKNICLVEWRGGPVIDGMPPMPGWIDPGRLLRAGRMRPQSLHMLFPAISTRGDHRIESLHILPWMLGTHAP